MRTYINLLGQCIANASNVKSFVQSCQILRLVFLSGSPRDRLEYSRGSRGELEANTRQTIKAPDVKGRLCRKLHNLDPKQDKCSLGLSQTMVGQTL